MAGSLKRMVSVLSPLGIYSLGRGGMVDAELAAYAAALDIIEELFEDIRRKAFVQTAQGQDLLRHQTLVGVQERPEASVESRRELVIYRLSVAPFDYTPQRMLASVRAAGVEAELTENTVEEKLVLRITRLIDDSLSMDQVRESLSSMLPAHLDWELDYGELTWDLLDGANPSWDIWDAKDFDWNTFDSGNGGFFQ